MIIYKPVSHVLLMAHLGVGVFFAQAPSAISISPSSGSNSSSTFTIAVRDPNGASDVDVINLLVNNSLNGASSCYVAFVRASNLVVLVNDSGDANGVPAGTIVIGNPGQSASNSQCTIYSSGSSVVSSNGVLTLNLNISFTSSFGGHKVSYVAVRDYAGGNSGWQRLGVWGVLPLPTSLPRPLLVTPDRGLGAGPVPMAFTSRYSSSTSQGVSVVVGEQLDGNTSCYFGYNAPGNYLILWNAGTWLVLTPGGTGSVESAHCKIYAQGSFWTTNGLDSTLTLNIEFKSPLSGNSIVWLSASDSTGSSAWHTQGTWNGAQNSSKVEINISAMPIDQYQTPGSGALIAGCSSAQTVRQCVQKLFQISPNNPNSYRSQGVTGVRFFFTLANGYYSDPFLEPSGSVKPSWQQNMNLFFADLRSYGITSITPTPVFDTWSGPGQGLPGNRMQQRVVWSCGAWRTLYFVPWLPYGLDTEEQYPDRSCAAANRSYYDAAHTPSDIFWGWGRFFNLMNTVMSLAQSNRLDLPSLDYFQEAGMGEFTVHARFIYDSDANSVSTDVLGELRTLMANNGYAPRRVIPSANIPPSPTPASANCASYYGESALLLNLTAILTAVAGPWAEHGVPAYHDANGLQCWSPGDPTPPAYGPLISLPVWHSASTSTDMHAQKIYPTDFEPEIYSQNFHSSIWAFLAYRGLTSNNVVFGEANPVSCGGFSSSSAAAMINGYKASTLFSNAAGRVFMRPWHRTEVDFACVPSPNVLNPPYNPNAL